MLITYGISLGMLMLSFIDHVHICISNLHHEAWACALFKSWCSIFYVYCLYDRAALESTCFSTYRLMLVKVQYDSFLTFFCRILWSLKDRTWFLFWALMFGNMHTTCRYNYHTVQRSNSLNMILCCKNIPCDAMSFCNFIHFLAFSATINWLSWSSFFINICCFFEVKN